MISIIKRSRNLSLVNGIFYLFIASLPVEQLLANFLNLDFSPSRILAILFIFASFHALFKINTLPIPRIVLLVIIPIVVLLLHIPFSGDLSGFSNVQSMLLNILILAAACKYAVVRWDQVKHGLLLFSLIIHIVSVVTIYMLGLSFLWSGERLLYLDLDANGIGLWAALGVVSSILFLGEPNVHSKVKVVLLAGSVVSMIVIIASGSRTAIIVPVISLFLFYIQSSARRLTAGSIVAFGLIFYSGYWALQQSDVAKMRWDRTLNAEAVNKYGNRDIVALAAFDVFLEKPVLGWGEVDGLHAMGMQLGFRRFGTHNSYLYYFVATGLVGGIPFMVFMLLPITQLRSFRGNRDYSLIAALLTFNCIAFLSIDWHYSKHHWMFYGMLLGCNAIIRRSKDLKNASS